MMNDILYVRISSFNIRQPGTGGLESGAGATPLVDATVRFFEEFMLKDESPPTQLPLQQDAREDIGRKRAEHCGFARTDVSV